MSNLLCAFEKSAQPTQKSTSCTKLPIFITNTLFSIKISKEHWNEVRWWFTPAVKRHWQPYQTASIKRPVNPTTLGSDQSTGAKYSHALMQLSASFETNVSTHLEDSRLPLLLATTKCNAPLPDFCLVPWREVCNVGKELGSRKSLPICVLLHRVPHQNILPKGRVQNPGALGDISDPSPHLPGQHRAVLSAVQIYGDATYNCQNFGKQWLTSCTMVKNLRKCWPTWFSNTPWAIGSTSMV